MKTPDPVSYTHLDVYKRQVIVSVIFGSVLLLSGIMRYKDREYAHLQTLSDIKIEQMEGTLEGMESVIRYFLSDVEMLNALQEFARLEVDTYEELYYNEAASAIREKLSTYYLIDEYYRVDVYKRQVKERMPIW